jgi:hypothetical protein
MLWAIMQRKRVINGDVDSAQEYAARKLNIGMQRERERERERERGLMEMIDKENEW